MGVISFPNLIIINFDWIDLIMITNHSAGKSHDTNLQW